MLKESGEREDCVLRVAVDHFEIVTSLVLQVKIGVIVNKMSRTVLVVLFLLTYVGVGYSANGHRHLRSVFGAIFESRPHVSTINAQSTTCVGCSKHYGIDEPESKNMVPESEKYSVTEQEFTALRIEYIKNQILKKLRLKEKPQVSMTYLPQPVTENDFILPKVQEDYVHNRYSDDFYGKTTQAIIFPYEDEARCVRKIRHPSACIPFQMPTDILATDVSSAELWFHKEADALDAHNQTFVISEVAHWDTNRSFQKTKPIAIQDTNLSEGWLKIDVAYVVKNWLEYQDSPTHAINVACKTCGMGLHRSPVSFSPSLKPFLVIYTHSQHRRPSHRRPKRQINCGPGISECCRESLYVSFAEIGWDDWIIEPAGYNAYFCKGSCETAASVTLSATQHNTILHKVMYGSNRNNPQRLELTPCCAATQFQPLQLLFMDNNKTITSKILSNMIVDSCGCM